MGGEEGREIITGAAPSVSRLTFPLKLFIYNTEWMGGGQGKLAVNRHCQHCCLSATGNWQLYFCSHGLHSLSLLSVAPIFSFPFCLFPLCFSLICLFSSINSSGLMLHTLFWQSSFASLTLHKHTHLFLPLMNLFETSMWIKSSVEESKVLFDVVIVLVQTIEKQVLGVIKITHVCEKDICALYLLRKQRTPENWCLLSPLNKFPSLSKPYWGSGNPVS